MSEGRCRRRVKQTTRQRQARGGRCRPTKKGPPLGREGPFPLSPYWNAAQVLGRLPWLAAFLRRARRLRPVLLIGPPVVVQGKPQVSQMVPGVTEPSGFQLPLGQVGDPPGEARAEHGLPRRGGGTAQVNGCGTGVTASCRETAQVNDCGTCTTALCRGTAQVNDWGGFR